MNKFNGFLHGLLSSASFGLIPLLTIPAMREGIHFESILFYWFLFACLALGYILLLDKQLFYISRKEIPLLPLLAFLYLISAVFLFWEYKFMASGVATTIHFMYPVLTTLIMMIFLREKKSAWRFFAIAPVAVGVSCPSYDDSSGGITVIGLFIVLLSVLGYALCLVTVSQLKVGQMKGSRLTFYVFLFGTLFLLVGIDATTGIQAIPDWHMGGNLLLLVLIPTVISNLALVQAVRSISSTLTSVLGAMKPVVAVCVGIFMFGKPFTRSIGIDILLVISAVIVIILRR